MSTLLKRRRIEAEFAKTVFEEMVPPMGEAQALDLLGAVARSWPAPWAASWRRRIARPTIHSPFQP